MLFLGHFPQQKKHQVFFSKSLFKANEKHTLTIVIVDYSHQYLIQDLISKIASVAVLIAYACEAISSRSSSDVWTKKTLRFKDIYIAHSTI